MQRLLVFLLANSILFLGFVQLEGGVLSKVVSSVGICTCFILVAQTWRIKRRLDDLDRQLNKRAPKWYVQPVTGRATGFWLTLVFLAIWVASFFA